MLKRNVGSDFKHLEEQCREPQTEQSQEVPSEESAGDPSPGSMASTMSGPSFSVRVRRNNHPIVDTPYTEYKFQHTASDAVLFSCSSYLTWSDSAMIIASLLLSNILALVFI